jgi:hypothetical protein
MAADGFNLNQLDDFSQDLLSLATRIMPRETKKVLKKEATKLSKVQKNKIKSFGIGGQGITEKEILSSSKSGKVYKYSGNLNCRAFNSHPLAHLLDKGYTHKGGNNHDGAETFVVGYNFIEKAEEQFKNEFYQDIEQFIDDMIDEGL